MAVGFSIRIWRLRRHSRDTRRIFDLLKNLTGHLQYFRSVHMELTKPSFILTFLIVVLLLASLMRACALISTIAGKRPKFVGCKMRSMRSPLVFLLSGVFTPVRRHQKYVDEIKRLRVHFQSASRL